MPEPIENLYFNWLCAKVNRVDHPTPSLTYWSLFRQLHTTEYVWIISGDDNRAEDGVELRTEFLNLSRQPYNEAWEVLGCSVFEMLIAFSRKAEFNTHETAEYWFWQFLANLQLAEANDASDTDPQDVDNILNTFVWRLYDRLGRGGMFPMSHTEHDDQREVEVWYQFCAYLVDIDYPL